MIQLELKMMAETPNSTLSLLTHGEKILGFVIEDGFRSVKEYGKTRIPAGNYQIRQKRDGKFYARYKAAFAHAWVPELMDVPGFQAILIHAGNYVTDTDGCLLVNSTIGYDEKTRCFYGGGSKVPYKRLYQYLDLYAGKETIMIKVSR